ncbi:MAG: DMT family transporter [Hoeflea sp.]|uniref:DMT family transporter n=1 Tax=Hoeflea sp. TaxID=1940281 RepID=UPI001D3CCE6E|nr:DMT family transporter [Hoeflea sp.]MBU4527203.1 DMT family transporter [Alphaproteobacteria bacterium]MBU4547014.1 DMT family transporter [Alphaproteobacteria bacterium]MBU4551474.1 DMT family transporter [Alphaproteobacteria bacterium]MBV1725479.1 DMT family transporter [Hoeflea sp.]MBV1759527.1 DMT family transporter [Hoeflea sp.]
MPRHLANLLLLLAGAIWGAGFVAQSTAMESIGPFLFVGSRFLVAALVLAPFAWRESRKAPHPVSKAHLRGFGMIGLALFLAMGLQQVGLTITNVTNSGFLTGLYVVFVPVITLLVLGQKPHRVIWPAVLMTFIGIWMLAGGSMADLNGGDLLTIGCAFMYAVQVILVGRFVGPSGRPLTLSFVQFALASALGLAVGLATEPLSVAALTGALPEILYAGVVATGLAFTLQVIGQRYTTAPQAAIFLSTESLFAALFAVLLLGEQVPALGYAGGLLIFLAILLAELGPMARKKPAI